MSVKHRPALHVRWFTDENTTETFFFFFHSTCTCIASLSKMKMNVKNIQPLFCTGGIQNLFLLITFVFCLFLVAVVFASFKWRITFLCRSCKCKSQAKSNQADQKQTGGGKETSVFLISLHLEWNEHIYIFNLELFPEYWHIEVIPHRLTECKTYASIVHCHGIDNVMCNHRDAGRINKRGGFTFI